MSLKIVDRPVFLCILCNRNRILPGKGVRQKSLLRGVKSLLWKGLPVQSKRLYMNHSYFTDADRLM